MNNTNYLIRLKPIENYFFGGERTFRRMDSEKANYFARSNYYPQQTSILGLLRFVLLMQNGALPLKENKQKGDSLIGERSFDTAAKEPQKFGVINSVSPLLVVKGNEYYRFANGYEELDIEFCKGRSKAGGNKNDFIVFSKNYDHKKDYENCVINKDGNPILFSEIFEITEQIGIEKYAPDEGFYKQQLISLKDGFEFVFVANITNQYQVNGKAGNTILENTIVNFGGEQKQFFFKVEKVTSFNLSGIFKENPAGDKIVLFSDALVSNEVLKACKFSLNETENFRTVTKAFDGNGFSKLEVEFNLLKRGSILFPNDDKSKQDIISSLTSPLNFRQIGFNQFLIK